ncbi:MAG: acetolactate synthase small subunit [Butyricicoccaceae bacterium]
MEKYIISALVQNNSGVLARVSSLFGRRGFNIDSLTVSPTTDPTKSRISIVVIGDTYILDQVLKQMEKLEECIEVTHIDDQDAFCREMALVKFAADVSERNAIREVCDIYKASVVSEGDDFIIVSVMGTPSMLDVFLSVISNFNVIESSRTGVTAMYKDKRTKN